MKLGTMVHLGDNVVQKIYDVKKLGFEKINFYTGREMLEINNNV